MDERELIGRIRELVHLLKDSYGYGLSDILSAVDANAASDVVPISVFATDMSPLQALVTYLHDQHRQEFKDIARRLHRSYRAVWGAYNKQGITIQPSEFVLPLDAFDERLSILETVVTHLRESYKLKFSAIGQLLGKDQRTIWTIANRAKKKVETATTDSGVVVSHA